jgi:hypothetical protein
VPLIEGGVSMSTNRTVVACALAVALSGCGLFTPEKNLFSNDYDHAPGQASPQGMYEYNIVQHIQCEIRNGVWRASQLPNSGWLRQYGGLATLKLIVEDQGSLSPNASFLTPFGLVGAQSFTLGIGASGSANATRTETMAFTYSDGELYRNAVIDAKNGIRDCNKLQQGVQINSDLKIGQFIYDKVVVAGAQGPQIKNFSQLQFEINFVASLSGNITPTWKFTRTTVNGSGSLLSATRTNTNDLIVTLGPLNADTKALHNAAVIGSAVGGAQQAFTP